ncbi:hypothetical protein ON010_g7357 [Phytophthora cinnamomi]|nr:hypothetical protein ON010_g7357 [Phytophthora cinnamomi]
MASTTQMIGGDKPLANFHSLRFHRPRGAHQLRPGRRQDRHDHRRGGREQGPGGRPLQRHGREPPRDQLQAPVAHGPDRGHPAPGPREDAQEGAGQGRHARQVGGLHVGQEAAEQEDARRAQRLRPLQGHDRPQAEERPDQEGRGRRPQELSGGQAELQSEEKPGGNSNVRKYPKRLTDNLSVKFTSGLQPLVRVTPLHVFFFFLDIGVLGAEPG